MSGLSGGRGGSVGVVIAGSLAFAEVGGSGDEMTGATREPPTAAIDLCGGEAGFAVATLEAASAKLGLNVKVEYSSTSSESNTVAWSFGRPGYYGVYKGTKKITGTYGSFNCNRSRQSDGSWALNWAEGPGSGRFATYTTLEEGAVCCQDTVPADSIMAKARSLLDCGSPAAKAGRPAGAVAPTAKQQQDWEHDLRPAPPRPS